MFHLWGRWLAPRCGRCWSKETEPRNHCGPISSAGFIPAGFSDILIAVAACPGVRDGSRPPVTAPPLGCGCPALRDESAADSTNGPRWSITRLPLYPQGERERLGGAEGSEIPSLASLPSAKSEVSSHQPLTTVSSANCTWLPLKRLHRLNP